MKGIAYCKINNFHFCTLMQNSLCIFYVLCFFFALVSYNALSAARISSSMLL